MIIQKKLQILAFTQIAMLLGSISFASGNFASKDSMEVVEPSLYQNSNDSNAKYELPLSFVKFENLDWTRNQVIDQLKYLAGIYRQCSIRIGTVKIYNVASYQAPKEVSYTKPQMPIHGYQSIAQNVSITDRPLVFLVNGMLSNDHSTSFAVAHWKIYPELIVHPSVINTAWLIHPITSLEYEKREHPGCINCVLAHELGHVLMRDGMHNGDRPPNLMSSAKMGGRNSSLPPHICEEIFQSDLLKQLKY